MLKTTVVRLLLIVALLLPATVHAEGLHVLWDELLRTHVLNGKVDYNGFKTDEVKLDEYLKLLNNTEPNTLHEQERLALYINAYNAYTVKLILDKYKDGNPVKSIKDIGGLFSSPWSIRFVQIGGETLTLDNVEHDIIRPEFKDPRVHFAINCASKSCPPLLSEAYIGEDIDSQLDKSTESFLNDQKNTYLSSNVLYVSKIFDWFSEDFQDDIQGFVMQYALGELSSGIDEAGKRLKIKYLDYDWSLNSK